MLLWYVDHIINNDKYAMNKADIESTVISTQKPKDLKSVFFKKSHNLVFSQLSLSPVEHDILALFLTKLNKDHWQPFIEGKQIHSPTYKFSSDVLSSWFGVESSRMYSTLKEPAQRLSSKSIGIKDSKSQKFQFRALFKEITYDNACLVIVPNDLLMNEYLAISGGHSQVPHRTFRDIKKEHAKRLYTMLCRYKNKVHSTFHPQSINELHAYFGLLDKQGNLYKKTYEQTGKFVQGVIKPAIDEISKNEPNIQFLPEEFGKKVGFEYVKEGRKVVAIRFLFKWQAPKDIARQEHDERQTLSEVKSVFEMAELAFTLVETFSPGDSGNPTMAELNNMMSMAPQLMEKGYEMDGAFMQNFALAMAEAKLNPTPEGNSEGNIELD